MGAALLDCETTPEGTLRVKIAGDWLLGNELPAAMSVLDSLKSAPLASAVKFDTADLGNWNTALLTLLIKLQLEADRRGIRVDRSGLPEGARQLLELALAVPVREDARREPVAEDLLHQIGQGVLDVQASLRQLLQFTGVLVFSLSRVFHGKATFLRRDLLQHLQEAGAEALPIVSLISFLTGMIFAFVGVMQLNQFGAGIYTADLVAVAMTREMAPIMTAIIMAGRTGAAYAAEIGTMKVNEEVDALSTLGLNPIDFLVTPRVIALTLMMPLLTAYSGVMGVFGGLSVGMAMLDVSLVQYAAQTVSALNLSSLFGGLFKSLVYGTLIALAGCQQGMACGNSAMAVGQCTTNAVVMSIVLIVVSASILTIIYINLGI